MSPSITLGSLTRFERRVPRITPSPEPASQRYLSKDGKKKCAEHTRQFFSGSHVRFSYSSPFQWELITVFVLRLLPALRL